MAQTSTRAQRARRLKQAQLLQEAFLSAISQLGDDYGCAVDATRLPATIEELDEEMLAAGATNMAQQCEVCLSDDAAQFDINGLCPTCSAEMEAARLQDEQILAETLRESQKQRLAFIRKGGRL